MDYLELILENLFSNTEYKLWNWLWEEKDFTHRDPNQNYSQNGKIAWIYVTFWKHFKRVLQFPLWVRKYRLGNDGILIVGEVV